MTAHIGSACEKIENPNDTSTCKKNEEVFKVISDLPKGLVDVWIGGHTHAAIAHRISDVAVIESYSSGRAFGRVDLRITDTHVSGVTIFQPTLLCPLDKDGNPVLYDLACPKAKPTPTPTPPLCDTRLIGNDGFETGHFNRGWIVDNANPSPAVSNALAHTGTFAAFLGGSLPLQFCGFGNEPTGDSSFYQEFGPAC